MAQWVKMLTTAKSVALRFPGSHQVEGKNQLLQTVLFPNSYCGDLTYATCKINVIIKKTQVGVAMPFTKMLQKLRHHKFKVFLNYTQSSMKARTSYY